MPDLDKQRIIQGTPNKVIRLAHEKMKSEYTTESAKEFYDVYSKYDLPVILESSRFIFSEPEFGLPYYKEIMESGCIPFHCYYEEREKVHEYLESYKDKMNDVTKGIYTSLCESVDTLFDNHKCSLIAECRIDADENKAMKFCTEAVKYLKDTENQDQRVRLESSFDELNDYEKILYATEKVSSLGLSYELSTVLSSNYNESVGEDIEKYSSNMHLVGFMNFIGNDECMKESVSSISNINLKLNMKGLMLESTSYMMENSILSNIIAPSNETIEDPSFYVESVWDEVTNEEHEFTETVNKLEEYDNQVRKYIGYNDALAYVMAESTYLDENEKAILPNVFKEYCEMNDINCENMTIGEAESLLAEAVSEIEELIYTYEYSNDGTQTAVIRNHATSMREGITADTRKAKPKHTEEWKKNLSEEKDDGEDDDDEDNDVNDALKISHEETSESDKPSSDVPDVSSKGKPVLAKRPLHQRIQAKALDADVKAMSGSSKLKQGVTNVVQTGKAILRVPGHIVTDLKTFLDGWKNMDENARKEAMLKPGYRKKFYKRLKRAIVYGVTWSIHPYLAVVAWLCRKVSKEKNQYIRNELAMELQTEIKVCEEKIEDAKNKDDQKEKYRLMRIRDKLEKERVRVISNAKYV